MTVIGLGGKLRAGKDAVADRLVERHGYVKIGMSDALHEAMLAIDPIINAGASFDQSVFFVRYSEAIEDLGYTDAKKIPEVRRLLQALGTDVGRKMIDENVWANMVGRRIDELVARGIPVVVTGLRFPNELTIVCDRADTGAAWTVWVERPGIEAPSTGTASHSSENSVGVDDFDLLIENEGTLEQLYAKVDQLAFEAAGIL